MTTFADFYGAQSPQLVKDYGFDGVSRYLSHQQGKCATPQEIAGYRNANLMVALNFEDGATNWMNGRSQGNADGSFAASLAREIGYPTNCAIIFSIDYDANLYQFGQIFQYLEGASGYGYPIGVYGSYNVVQACMEANVVEVGWQTAAWSGGYLYSGATMYQHIFGQLFDSSAVVRPFTQSWGWNNNPIVVPPAPNKPVVIIPSEEEEEMPLLVLATGPNYKNVHSGFVYQIWSDGHVTGFPGAIPTDVAAARKLANLPAGQSFNASFSCEYLYVLMNNKL